MAETNTPRLQDAAGECLLYDEYMTRVFISDAKEEERAALRVVLLDLNMEVAGEATDWPATLVQVPINRIDMLVIDWDLLPNTPGTGLGRTPQSLPGRADRCPHQLSERSPASRAFCRCRRFYQQR